MFFLYLFWVNNLDLEKISNDSFCSLFFAVINDYYYYFYYFLICFVLDMKY
jgi:hypothetical protein